MYVHERILIPTLSKNANEMILVATKMTFEEKRLQRKVQSDSL